MDRARSSKLITRSQQPINLESSFIALKDGVTNSQFFVRDHFPAPRIEPDKCGA